MFFMSEPKQTGMKKLKKCMGIFKKIQKDRRLQDYLGRFSLKTTCLVAPLQIEGTVFRKYLYFRSRWQDATIEIAESKKDLMAENVLFTKSKHYSKKKYGKNYASWLSQAEALKLIAKWVAEFEKKLFNQRKVQRRIS